MPKAEYLYSMSPYNSMKNKPISNIDPHGDFPVAAFVGFTIGAAVTGLAVANNENLFQAEVFSYLARCNRWCLDWVWIVESEFWRVWKSS